VRFGSATRLIEMPIAWSVDDFPHFEYLRTPTHLQQGLMNAGHVMENWYDDFEFMARHLQWGLLTYTCHPFVSGRGHRLLALERLIERLLERGAQFTTLERIAREFDEREPFAG
jgi:peptidoglycan/xylan/chitin deacetylase (PgdA/CDA1 family)